MIHTLIIYCIHSNRSGERSRRPREADRTDGRLRPGAHGHTGKLYTLYMYTEHYSLLL